MGTLKPTLRLRKLGLALRRYREAAGLTLDEAAAVLNRHASSISRIEKGLHHCPVHDVEYYLIKYGVTDPTTYLRLYDLSRNARKKGWWHQYKGDLSHDILDFISLESDAVDIDLFELAFVPGLFQTRAYARTIIGGGIYAFDADRVERLVEVRMRRQELLTGQHRPRHRTVVDEAALRRQVGGKGVMRAQLERLIEVSYLPLVTLQVLPFGAGQHLGMDGSFKILHLGQPGNLRVVTVDSLTEMSYREEEPEIHIYVNAFDRLQGMALSASDSRDLIERLLSKS